MPCLVFIAFNLVSCDLHLSEVSEISTDLLLLFAFDCNVVVTEMDSKSDADVKFILPLQVPTPRSISPHTKNTKMKVKEIVLL